MKRLLQIIASSVPFKPNYTAISQRSGISINTLKSYISYLSDAELILLLHPRNKGMGNLGKPEKIYLHNPGLVYNMVGKNAEIANVPDSFIVMDDIETGYDNVIPLWMFGFLY